MFGPKVTATVRVEGKRKTGYWNCSQQESEVGLEKGRERERKGENDQRKKREIEGIGNLGSKDK